MLHHLDPGRSEGRAGFLISATGWSKRCRYRWAVKHFRSAGPRMSHTSPPRTPLIHSPRSRRWLGPSKFPTLLRG